MLQLVLNAFMRVVGIYPSGSVVYLRNGQMAYIADSEGPICIPFTDRYGNPLPDPHEPFVASSVGQEPIGLNIDRRRVPLPPKDIYDKLPESLREV